MGTSSVYTEHLTLCNSTMDIARDRVSSRSEIFGLITTEEQTAGRGRRGNTWRSPHGSFIGTFWIRTDLEPARLSGLSLAVGVLLVQVLEQLGVSVWLKWPNDLVTVDSRKLGGILVEVGTGATSALGLSGVADELGRARRDQQFVLVGVGINSQAPAEMRGVAAGILDLVELAGLSRGATLPDVEHLSARIAERLEEQLPPFWDRFCDRGLSAFLGVWRDRCINIGKNVEFTRGAGRERGVFVNVGEAGEALLNVNGAIERFFSGEIHTVREVAPLME